MIGNTGQFFFYLAAVICFVIAAFFEGAVVGRFGRPGAPRIAFVPLGLALWLFPLMWNTGKVAL